MAKPSTLKNEGGYWTANIRGRKHRFGNSKKVSRSEAQRKFIAALAQAPGASTNPKVIRGFTVAQMVDDYLDWLAEKTSAGNTANRKALLKRFVRATCQRTERRFGTMKAAEVQSGDFETFIDEQRDLAPGSIWHLFKGLSACWNWAAGCKGHAASHLPSDHRPFLVMKCPPKPAKELTADKLMRPDEFQLIMERAKKYYLDDLFMVMYETGCRPGELAKAKVADFDGTQIVLHKHKNSTRSQDAKPRRIRLRGKSLGIVERLCNSRPNRQCHIFLGPHILESHSSRIDPELVDQIREALAEAQPVVTSPKGGRPSDVKIIAERFGVSRHVVQRIKRGKPYKSDLKQRRERKKSRREDGYSATTAWTSTRIARAFREIRGQGIRHHLTPYSFRDLFISEALRIGVKISDVAIAVGTSAKMIEKHYGHFYEDDIFSLHDQLAAAREHRNALIHTQAQDQARAVVAVPNLVCDTSLAPLTLG